MNIIWFTIGADFTSKLGLMCGEVCKHINVYKKITYLNNSVKYEIWAVRYANLSNQGTKLVFQIEIRAVKYPSIFLFS